MNTKIIIKTFFLLTCTVPNARLHYLEDEYNPQLPGCLLTEQLTNVPKCSAGALMENERIDPIDLSSTSQISKVRKMGYF